MKENKLIMNSFDICHYNQYFNPNHQIPITITAFFLSIFENKL